MLNTFSCTSSNNFFGYILFFSFFFCSSFIKGQSEDLKVFFPNTLDSLNLYQSHDKSLIRYKNHFRDLQDSINSSRNRSLLYELKPYLDWIMDHPSADSILKRSECSYYAYSLKNFVGDVDLAIYYYTLAHKFGGNLSSVNDFFYVEHPLGISYNIKGDHDRSQYFYKKTINGLNRLINDKTIDEPTVNAYLIQRARAFNNLGFLYYWNQSHDQALEILYEALNELKAQSYFKGIAYSYQYLGETYVALNETDSIQKYASLIEDILPKLSEKKQATMLVVHHQLLGKTSLLAKDYENAIAEFKNALKIKLATKDIHNTRYFAKAYNDLAQAYLYAGYLEKSREMIHKGSRALSLNLKELINNPASLYEENAIAELLETNAYYYEKKYQQTKQTIHLDSALISLNRSIKIYELLRDEYLLKGSKFLSIAENRRLVEKSIDLLFQKQAINGYDSSIILQVENLFAKSKNLLLFEYNNERRIINSLPDDKRAEIKQHQAQMVKLTTALIDKQNAQSKDQITSELLEHRLCIKQLLGKVKTEETSFSKEPFIEYLLGEQYLYSIDNFSGEKKFRKLAKSNEITSLIEQSQQGIHALEKGELFYDVQFRLCELLFGKGATLPDEFTIIPDDLLFFLAFPALITNRKENRFLIQDHIIKTAYSKATNNNKVKDKDLLLTIAPIYPKIPHETQTSRGGLYYLAEAKGEIEAILSTWSGEFSSYENISKSQFFESLKKASVLHYAGHTIVDGNNGYIVLSQDSSTWVSHEEIAQLTDLPQTIILSTCETGLGQLNYGEGVSSLAKSFLLGGTQSIVYSLWSINDQTSAQLMKYFYNYHNKGASLAASMAYAQRDYLDDCTDADGEHPYYWAAFVVVDNSVSKNNFKITFRMGLLFLCSITLIGILYFLIKRNS